MKIQEMFVRSPDDGGGGGPAAPAAPGAAPATPAAAPAAPAAPGAAPATPGAAPAAPGAAPAAPAAPADPAAPAGLLGGTGGVGEVQKPEWASGISDETWGQLSGIELTSAEGMAKTLVGAQKMVGADKVALPGENATEAELTAFYDKIRPEKATDYKFTMNDGVKATPDDLAFQGVMGEVFHEAGMSTRQVDLVNGKWNELTQKMVDEDIAAVGRETEETKAFLRREFGVEADNKLAAANAALEAIGGTDLVTLLNEKGVANNKAMVSAMLKISDAMMGEGDLVGLGGGLGGQSIDAQIKELRGKPDYHTNEALRQRVVDLEKQRG